MAPWSYRNSASHAEPGSTCWPPLASERLAAASKTILWATAQGPLGSSRAVGFPRKVRTVRTSDRAKIIWAVVGLMVCAVGVGWLLVRGPDLVGTVLAIVGGSVGVGMLASLWIYRSSR